MLRPYCSLNYAWDEPAQPHRLVLELPGSRALGTFNLDQASMQLLSYLATCFEPVGMPGSRALGAFKLGRQAGTLAVNTGPFAWRLRMVLRPHIWPLQPLLRRPFNPFC